MSKRLFILLVVFMSLCLTGIIFVQAYWINNSYKNNENRFNVNVRQALIEVSKELQLKEQEYYYRLYVEVADSIGEPDSTTFREIVYTHTDNQTSETFIYSSNILEEDYKISSNFLEGDFDSLSFKKLVNKKYTTTFKSGVDGSVNTETSESVIRRLEDPERFQIRDAIKDIANNIPIHKRLNVKGIKESISNQLKLKELAPNFEFAVFGDGLATNIVSEDFVYQPKSKSLFSVPLFLDDAMNYRYELIVTFSKKEDYLLSNLLGMAVLTLILTTIIILAYYSVFKQLLKQRQISEVKTDFINNMTHEFKTPIATINLALDALKNPIVSENKETTERYLKIIKDENKRMHAQVENVLRISKLEKNDLDIKKERLKLHDLIEDAISHVQLIVEDRGGYINTHLEAHKSSILANPSHFTNVIVNILDNAIKYTDGAPKIDVYTENVKNNIILKIKDQGIGMNKNVQKRVFEKFYREPTGNIHNVKGHGLGLSYVKSIVEDHQGQIYVESEKGKGSTFIINLQLIS